MVLPIFSRTYVSVRFRDGEFADPRIGNLSRRLEHRLDCPERVGRAHACIGEIDNRGSLPNLPISETNWQHSSDNVPRAGPVPERPVSPSAYARSEPEAGNLPERES
jgi:hypothetical protein